MNICVYCGSRSGDRPEYEAAAIAVGKEIVNRGWGLVYGGGGIGLMGVVARTVYEAGLPVIGIIPTFLATREIAFWECTELIEVPSMHVRKQLMIERSDMLMAMPGGFGTMDELFEALTLLQTGTVRGITVVLVGRAFWERLINWPMLVEEGLISPEDLHLIHYAETAQETWDIIANTQQVSPRQPPSANPLPPHP